MTEHDELRNGNDEHPAGHGTVKHGAAGEGHAAPGRDDHGGAGRGGPAGGGGSGQGAVVGRAGGLTDVAGLRVGHATLTGDGHLTGTTVVLAPEGGAVAAVDVRGGGPGTKETDALDPRNVAQRIDAVVLTGGSAYGLDAAAGVMSWLEEHGRGFRVGSGFTHVVPVVPAACIFDLGRGGDFRARPDAATGRAAVEAAAASASGTPVPTGCVGAGTGAVVGGLKGGVGTASTVLDAGITVAALVVVNAVGSALHPATGALYGEFLAGRVRYPDPQVHAAAQRKLAEAGALRERPPLNTTLAVVATDAALTRAQAQKLAGTAHDGIARAVHPVHLMHDGDTVFALATGEHSLTPSERPAGRRADQQEKGETGAGVGTGTGTGTGTDAAASAGAVTGAGGSGDGAGAATDADGGGGGVGAAGLAVEAAAAHVLNEILAAGADQVTRAVVGAVRAAESVTGPGGTFPCYQELYGTC